MSGKEFRKAQIRGVVEEDFFDWPLTADGGADWIRTVAQRVASFDWSVGVEHDVLKVLYESVISPEQRHSLGEYYTPDWLAEIIVKDTVDDPLRQRVHDPSCGSGTFLFHAVRHYLRATDEAKIDTATAIGTLVQRVSGVDVHPVAVTLARVTYLLAIGRDRLRGSRPSFHVPVYLGDSLAWQQEDTVFAGDDLVIPTDDGLELFAGELRFPSSLLEDVEAFDRLVGDLADRATSPERAPNSVPGIRALLRPLGLSPSEVATIEATFKRLCDLHDHQRDHIWGYYTRNLARPLWLALTANRVDRLVGNPPWLTYNAMPASMQETFRKRSTERGLWSTARNHDLAPFFVARCVEQYLRDDGRFAFVMPHAVLSRKHAAGFRTGNWSGKSIHLKARFDTAWDMAEVEPAIFPVPACVIRGRRTGSTSSPLDAGTVTYQGRLPDANVSWDTAATCLSTGNGSIAVSKTAVSPYNGRFEAGAKIDPRVLFVVEDAASSPLGLPAELRRVRSRQSVQAKKPWKYVAPLEHSVERAFIRPLVLGESIAPFRVMDNVSCVVPWHEGKLMTPDGDAIEAFAGIAEWWRAADRLWRKHRSSEKFDLVSRYDYQRRLSRQIANPSPQRVVYTKSGSIMAAARVVDTSAVIDQKLYWAAVDSEPEAQYLCGIFNSRALTAAVAPYQSRGQFGTRDFDKYIFQLPIPQFDPDAPVHADISRIARACEEAACALVLDADKDFKTRRRHVREKLAAIGLLDELDARVKVLLG